MHLVVKNALKAAIRVGEHLVFGGNLRERAIVGALGAQYRSAFRRAWRWSPQAPHFYNHRWSGFALTFGAERNPYVLARGFYAAELIRDGDTLLDIGCGDGWFTRSFFARRCRHIDAVDIEPSAIALATRHNGAPNITYQVLDAVREPFPGAPYDIVVWDGAIGHFAAETVQPMLAKIKASLSAGGIFCGSESLGTEGTDHLQYFAQLADIGALMRPHFAHIQLKELAYHIPRRIHRREAFWRCSDDGIRLAGAEWSNV
jgi:SAM-dependent methyltransferase